MAPIIAFMHLPIPSYIRTAGLGVKHLHRRDQSDETLKLLNRLVRA